MPEAVAGLHRLRARDSRRVRWRNDGGWTTEIARGRVDASSAHDDDFDWRLSIADIESDGPFSPFPGMDRDLVLIAGTGIELDIDEAAPLRLDRRFQQVRFAGEQRVNCRLLAGPTRDFNVIVRRGALVAETVARPLTGSMLLFPRAGTTWFAHVLAGTASARADSGSIEAECGDTLVIGADTGHRVVLDGAGEIVLVRLADANPRALRLQEPASAVLLSALGVVQPEHHG